MSKWQCAEAIEGLSASTSTEIQFEVPMRVPRVTLDMLVAVIAVAQRKTLDKAAEELGLGSASAVQKRIRAANGFFHTALFTKTEEGMVLTETGLALYPDAVRTVEQALLAEERVFALMKLKARRLLIGHTTYLPPKLLAAVLRLGFDDGLAIAIEHISGLTEGVVQRVLDGTLHAGFGYLPIPRAELLARVVFEEPLVVAMAAGHPFSVKPHLRPQDLKGEPIIAVGRHSLPGLHEEIEDFFSGFGVTLKVVADAFGPPEALMMVEQKIGICLVGASAVARPGVLGKPLQPSILTRKSGLFVREDNRHPTVKVFVDRVLETMSPRLKGR
jgi:DNA-binding transcriptional LysR family regulator